MTKPHTQARRKHVAATRVVLYPTLSATTPLGISAKTCVVARTVTRTAICVPKRQVMIKAVSVHAR